MGSCLCKEKRRGEGDTNNPCCTSNMADSSESSPKRARTMDPEIIDQYIMDMLAYVSSHQAPGEAPPEPLLQLNTIADTGEGWLIVVHALIRAVPLESPLAASTMNVIFDDCPLPTRNTVLEFMRSLNLNSERANAAYESAATVRQERNVLLLIGFIAEKFCGPQCAELLNEDVLNYLLTFLVKQENPVLVIHALVAFEKFAINKENKGVIDTYFGRQLFHPLLPLDSYHASKDFMWRQVGFIARWALDNTFEFKGRSYSFESQDMNNINAILNVNDTSGHLKISADGLEARCDTHTFESVRATYRIETGCWYYEAEIVSSGVMQIGWASEKSCFQIHDGFGVGDDAFSLAYDGCRLLIWHRAVSVPQLRAFRWQSGDVLGCLIDIDRKEAIFSLNGRRLPVFTDLFNETSEGYYPAASFMAHQQCRFNFGSEPFAFPPTDRPYWVINEHAILTDEQKKVIPRHIILENIRLEDRPDETTCSICYNGVGNFGVNPCEHSGFCQSCVNQLRDCPLCRCPVQSIYIVML